VGSCGMRTSLPLYTWICVTPRHLGVIRISKPFFDAQNASRTNRALIKHQLLYYGGRSTFVRRLYNVWLYRTPLHRFSTRISPAELKGKRQIRFPSLELLHCACLHIHNAFLRSTCCHQFCYLNHDFPIRHRYSHRLLSLQGKRHSRAERSPSTRILELVRAAPGSHLRHAERRKAIEHATQLDQREEG
jgi:hypothetical protein